MEPFMSRIAAQLVEVASGRAGSASGKARVEAVATGMRNSIFNVFFTPSHSGAKYEIAFPAAASRTSQSQKNLEQPQNCRFFRL
jgi:hypothetical protein